MSTQREVRYLVATEVRAKGGSGAADDPLRIEGYAAVYNRSAQLPGFKERIQPNAFKRAIDAKQDVVCLFNHDSNLVLGRTTSGTLRVDQDARGLHYVCDLPNTQAGRDTHESIKRGDISGCSFAFTVPEGGQRWSEEEDEDGEYYVMRDLTDLNLHDVSPVTYPTYGGTNVYARSTDAIEAPAELRSAVDAKNTAKRGMMDMKAIDVPAKKENPVDPTQNAEPQKTEEEIENEKIAAEKAAKKAKSRSLRAKATELKVQFRDVDGEDSFEEAIREVCTALQKAFPGESAGEGLPVYAKYWEVETYVDYVIVQDVQDSNYFKIPYTHDESKPEGEEITFGEPVEVEKTYVPVERDLNRTAEVRFKKQVADLTAASEVVPPAVPWHPKYAAVLAGAVSATEALRYATDQPRNNGSFGSTDAERASSMSEHSYAVRAHVGKASSAMDAENHSGAMAHLRAAHDHAVAARAHKEKSEDRFGYSVKAQTVSKEANRSY